MFVLFACVSVNVWGQSLAITGTVTDEKGEPIIGASVLVVGTTNGSITDFDGNFSLKDVASNAKLSISYIGMKTNHRCTRETFVQGCLERRFRSVGRSGGCRLRYTEKGEPDGSGHHGKR
jgi:hypothetical protein